MMMVRMMFAVLLVTLPCLAGCGDAVKEEDIEVQAANDPLFEPRSILARYAEGQAPGSEVESFPGMVQAVRKIDPGRADILEKGWQDILAASPDSRAGKAKELLDQLQPSMQ